MELDVPISSHDALEFGADFIVEDLEVHLEASGGEAVHDGVVGSEAMIVVSTGEAGLKDDIGVAVVSNHDVLFATASTNREAASVISVEFADVAFPEVQFVGALGWKRRGWMKSGLSKLGLGGTESLA